MKVLLVNGSPHKNGCTCTALGAVGDALNQNGVSTDLFWIGTKPIGGCIGCHQCAKRNQCVFDDKVNEFLSIAGDYDGYVFGTPVHWGAAAGNMTSFLDRVFYADLNAGGDRFRLKPASGLQWPGTAPSSLCAAACRIIFFTAPGSAFLTIRNRSSFSLPITLRSWRCSFLPATGWPVWRKARGRCGKCENSAQGRSFLPSGTRCATIYL